MKINLSYFLIVGLLVGCSSNDTPQSVTENYLSLMQKGNDSYTDYVCVREKSEPEIEGLITGMSSFQIQDITFESEGYFIAQVTGIRDGDEFSFKLPVHETEDLYQKAQELVADLNTESFQPQETLQTKATIGALPMLKTPERLDYSLKKFCVTASL